MTDNVKTAQHTPEPWSYIGHGTQTISSGANYVASIARYNADTKEIWVNEADGKRIVAAVNACAGIPTEALEAGAIASGLQLVADWIPMVEKLTEQKHASGESDAYIWGNFLEDLQHVAAINKGEGRA
jgi:hypothetical protein